MRPMKRYSFRIWLLAFDMGNDEFKKACRVLLHPLSGNAAFKDQAMEDRWKEKQTVKREMLKAAKARQEEKNTTCEPEAAGEEVGSDAVSA